jgi:hypothetical protein
VSWSYRHHRYDGTVKLTRRDGRLASVVDVRRRHR